MSTPLPESFSTSSPTSVFHVSIHDGSVEVSGGTPQEVVDLLHAAGNRVVIDGDVDRLEDLETADGLSELSARELHILGLIASGLSNAEVAGETYLSINTIKSYIRSCYRKIDAHSRSQAVIWAIDHGVVDAHPHADGPRSKA